MKILIVNSLYAPNQIGGAEKSVQILAEKFSLLGHAVKVVCLNKENLNYELENVGVKAIRIKNNYWPFGEEVKNPAQKFLWHLKDSRNTSYNQHFKEIIKEFKPDIFFTNNLSGFSTNIWAVAKTLGVKIVHTLRDYYLQCPKSTKFKNNISCENSCLSCKILSNSKKINSHNIDYVVGISNYILDDHLNRGYFNGVPNEVIFNGFNLEHNESKKAPKKAVVFGFMGQIKESKGIELILKCFSKITNDHWKLLVAGKTNTTYLSHLNSLNNSSKIEYLGFVKNDDFFKKIDVLVVPSIWNEPFGRVVLESFINKTPVLASNVGGISELMFQNKNFLFETNQESLTQQIEKILLNPEVLNHFNFNQEFISNFSIDETIRKYLNIFERIVNNKQ